MKQSLTDTIAIRLVLSIGLGFAFGSKATRFALQHEMPRDFDQVWFAAGALLSGRNPYHLIGPGRSFPWEFPFFYPLPAALIATPVAALPVAWADGVFVAAGTACFVWAITQRGYATLPCLLAVPFLAAVQTAQWSPLLAASVVVAPLGFFTVAKPTIGAALFFARPTRWPIVGAVLLTAVAFALYPGWFNDWMSGFAEAAARRPLHFSAPIVQPGGFVALAGLLRWRRREGRLITALACVPQTLVMYESVPLLLVPHTLGESLAMVLLTYIVDLLNIATVHGNQLYGAGKWLWILYGGAALIVLRRPNSDTSGADATSGVDLDEPVVGQRHRLLFIIDFLRMSRIRRLSGRLRWMHNQHPERSRQISSNPITAQVIPLLYAKTEAASRLGESADPAVSRGRRMFVALVIGVLCAARTTLLLRAKHYPGDFEQVWYAARAILAGNDPYQLIGPGRPFAYDFMFRYPLTAAVIAIPVTPLRADIASGLLVGLGIACLAWVLMRHGHGPLIGLLSASVISVMDSVQWSPLFAAATVIAPLGVVFAAKPTIGLAMFAARPSRWALVSGIAVTGVAFAIQPQWVTEWRVALTDRVGISAFVLKPGGAIALLCLLKWRRPEARMLAVLVCVPMTPVLYECVPLLLIPRRWWEATLLVLASYVVALWMVRHPLTDLTSYAASMASSAQVIALVLIPLATVLILMRPNEGSVPRWVEQRLGRAPLWIRGAPPMR